MAGSFPNLSRLEKDLEQLLLNRAGNNRPVLKGSSIYNPQSGVSGLSTWIRIISTAKPLNKNTGGLVIDSIYPFNSFEKRYGNEKKPGIIGYELDLRTPVEIENTSSSRGFRPSPIIESLSVQDGRYREFSFSIKAFTVEQLEKITEYFMEPGFHILCEWGWNIPQSRREIVGAGAQIEPCDIAQYDKWSYIMQKRRLSGFTYDAGLAIITGGDISFNSDDESYTLSVKTKGIGHVAEYMQTHKGGVRTDSNDVNTGNGYSPADIESFQSNGNIGKSLFAQMVNELPSFKQTNEIKSLINNPKFSDKANFVNFDSVMRDILIDSLNSANTLKTKQGEIKLPKDAPLFSEERFIRMELAVEIINRYDFNLEPQSSGLCPQKKTRDLRIDISDTIIQGFPHMFSSDPSKLFIPNTKAPNFNFVNALSNPDNPDFLKNIIDKENLDKKENLANLHPLTERNGNFSLKEEKNGESLDYQKGTSRPTPYAFPCRYGLDEEVKPINLTDETFIPPNERAYFWGWLKDLYINFDFFKSVIEKPNYLVRDVFYDMLNGLSTACNSLWHFDIIEIPSETEDGDMRLTVIDRNFSGLIDTNFDQEIEFIPSGIDSPFLAFGLETDIPSVMTNSIMQKKMSGNIEGNPENPIPSYKVIGNVFSNKEDEVGSILNFTKQVDEESEEESRTQTPKVEQGESNKNVVFDFITERGSLFPKIQDRNSKTDIVENWYEILGAFEGNDAFLEDLIFVGTWRDSKELSNIYYIDNGLHKSIKGSTNDEDKKRRNVPIGLIKIKFDVHGVSGFKLGNRMRFQNIPKKFSKNMIYQVTSIEQSIRGDGWVTSVTTESRPYEVEE